MAVDNFSVQIGRIKEKLLQAKLTDVDFKVFGASHHQYQLNKPITQEQLIAFEEKYGIQLPPCYKAFITQVGHGGNNNTSAAGPFYGIYPLEVTVDTFFYSNINEGLQHSCIIYPFMSDDFWQKQIEIITNDDIADDKYDAELTRIYGGILPIGSQGCSYLHGIVLNGNHAGKVVNLDLDHQKPIFTFEHNFLDWYERWLDEVISGQLIEQPISWFGHSMAGSEELLLKRYFVSDHLEYKYCCLEALLNKTNISDVTLNIIENQYQINTLELRCISLQIMTKFAYKTAKPYLQSHLYTEPLTVFKFLFWYAKDKINEWTERLYRFAPSINDNETFRFFTYLLQESGTDYQDVILPFTKHTNSQLRATAFFTLGNLPSKQRLVDSFINGLYDQDNYVICITLQALDGINDSRLLKHYQSIASRFPKEQDYILCNLNLRLSEFQLTNKSILHIDVDDFYSNYIKKKWYQFWK